MESQEFVDYFEDLEAPDPGLPAISGCIDPCRLYPEGRIDEYLAWGPLLGAAYWVSASKAAWL